MCNLTNGQRRYIDDLKAAHAAGFCVMYRPSQGCCWIQCQDPNWSNHPDCYMMELEDRRKWEQYKRERDFCTEQKNKPHPHAALIKAWADGAVIQFKSYPRGPWEDCLDNKPTWAVGICYRIKPEQTDLEKYGVEVGDVWCLHDTRRALVWSVIKEHTSVLRLHDNLPCYSVNKDRFATLLFRRGVVNKL